MNGQHFLTVKLLTFFAIKLGVNLENTSFYKLIEDIRKTRNEIVHVKPRVNISAESSLSYSLQVLTSFYGKDKWLEFLRDRYTADPMFSYSTEGISYFWRTLDFVWQTIGRSEFRKHLSIERQTRFYFCPSCSYDLFSLGSSDEIKISYLKPNKPESTELYCLICDKIHEIQRVNCNNKGCKGNVLTKESSGTICLTCFIQN